MCIVTKSHLLAFVLVVHRAIFMVTSVAVVRIIFEIGLPKQTKKKKEKKIWAWSGVVFGCLKGTALGELLLICNIITLWMRPD